MRTINFDLDLSFYTLIKKQLTMCLSPLCSVRKESGELQSFEAGNAFGLLLYVILRGSLNSSLAFVILVQAEIQSRGRYHLQWLSSPAGVFDLPADEPPTLFLAIRCYLEDGASKGAWLNRSSIIFAGGDKWSVDPRVSISTLNKRDYSLQIQNVDVTDDGPYTCSVQTQHTPRTMQVHLTVQVPPKIYDISNDMTINEGTNVTLTCLATGKPEPSISWRHISPSAKPFENGQYLDIYGITRDQAGEYECSAENDVSFPDVKKEIKSGTVAPGRSGLIRCEGAGVPPPAFEWYKGEKKLFNGQQGIIIQNFSTRSILTVTNVTQEHFGNYTCVAVNKLGTTNASLPLSRNVEGYTQVLDLQEDNCTKRIIGMTEIIRTEELMTKSEGNRNGIVKI
ncbi:hypothetical protein E5288_WYG007947 [Bos mutus]|uniref:Neuronal growth regulator 1 n=1 Tax=Bos mutus TaxID=72004 RepID=A0A6B0QW25_9CETA|nr:hypothetical protein [Bos mutus]